MPTGKESSRKERGHSASSAHRGPQVPKTVDQESRKKAAFSNFLNHTQKISLNGSGTIPDTPINQEK